MNSYTISVTFPSAPAGHAQHARTVKATRMPVAIYRALNDIMGDKHLAGRKLHQAKVVAVFNHSIRNPKALSARFNPIRFTATRTPGGQS